MTTKTELLKIIRRHCIACCCGSRSEVEACRGGKGISEYTTCYLHPFRFGTDPFAKVSEAKKMQGKRLAESRRKKRESFVNSV